MRCNVPFIHDLLDTSYSISNIVIEIRLALKCNT